VPKIDDVAIEVRPYDRDWAQRFDEEQPSMSPVDAHGAGSSAERRRVLAVDGIELGPRGS
jgi:hypothetical protein